MAPLWRVRPRWWSWVGVAAVSVSVVSWSLGVRGLRTAVLDPAFIAQILVMTGLAATAAMAALDLAVPGGDRPTGRLVAASLMGAWPGVLFATTLLAGASMAQVLAEPWHPTCLRTIALMAVSPAIALALLVRRGAPLRPGWAATMTGVAAAAVGAVGVAVICPISRWPHVLVAHAVPTLAVAALLAAVLSRLVRRRRSIRLSGVVTLVLVLIVVPARVSRGHDDTGQLPRFDVAATTGGYLSSGELQRFLASTDAPTPQPFDLERQRPALVAAAIVFGGMALNLTPCVLPMMPINLAIIGAGRRATSRRRGLLLGAAYGAAMAVAYGVLGGVVVMTAGTFGALNGSPWFNAAIAALFVVLGLAMFDVVTIDLSRWSGRATVPDTARGSVGLAFVMGGVAALLAGACVAPVVIQVVTMASDLYAGGSRSALALPFLLGLGMGLPWPFAGAGLAAMPRPGPWMVRVKQGLGVCILLLAVSYGYEAVSLARPHARAAPAGVTDGWYTSLKEGLAASRREGKPVFLDVWATWCKNCTVMDATTFRDPGVRATLDGYVKVRFQAEDVTRPVVSALLDRLGSVGLPTYAVLRPDDTASRPSE